MQPEAKNIQEKLQHIYPEINRYGLSLEVHFDQDKEAWSAVFKKQDHTLSTHLEPQDVESCLQGKECYHLGIQLGQFIRNYCEGGEECRL
jgi:hypothetical protein